RYHTLTVREKQVLSLICRGLTNQKIATLLSLSRNTVRTHRNHIWKKLAVRHCRDALAYRVLTEVQWS
ncbi:MAG: LuxR C-terminal-related transcriptional regulator, partial [Ekhidna sp.]|nr:LuxR C-terminal-related transcriptional regulator [Ekhidna sp.]